MSLTSSSHRAASGKAADVASARRRLTPEDRRAELLRACLDLIGERPWDEVAMTDVARAAGASKALLYHYFETKSELYHAAVRAAAEELREVTTPRGDLPLGEQLRSALDAHLTWIEVNERAYRAVLQGGISSDTDVEEIIEESRSRVVTRLAAGFSLRESTPSHRLILRGWVGFLEGASLHWLATREVSKPELIDILVAALLAVVPAPARA